MEMNSLPFVRNLLLAGCLVFCMTDARAATADDDDSSTADSTYTVEVTTAGIFIYALMAQQSDVDAVAYLTVTGTIDSTDMAYFEKLTNLRTIDLSGTDITSIGWFSGLYALEKVTLPTTVRTVKRYAFYNCESLTTVNLDSATSIGNGAFSDCSALKTVSLPCATSFGTYAFRNCTKLTMVSLPCATSIGNGAFSFSTALTTVSLPCATSIGNDAFYYCTKLTTVSLGSSLKSIGSDAFYDCSKLSTVYCYAVIPPETSAFANATDFGEATLYVPAFSVSTYRLDDGWVGFVSVAALEDVDPFEEVELSGEFSLTSTDGIAEDAHLALTPDTDSETAGHLTLYTAGETLKVGRFSMCVDVADYSRSSVSGGYQRTYPYISTLLAYTPMESDTVEVEMTVPTGEWSFISFPFNVAVADIEVPDNALWVVRRYSGENRAAGSDSTWIDVVDGETLEAGQGFIFHCAADDDAIEVVFRAVDDDNANDIFTTEGATLTLKEYAADDTSDRSWNLVGNPYPTYFDIQYLDFGAPLQTWSGGGYTAYTVTDDEYTLRPNEAFFVQCPTTSTTMTFEAEGRSHDGTSLFTTKASARGGAAAANSDRQVLNFLLSDGDYTDRARLVLNPQAEEAYEIACDAAKMAGSGVPQLWVLDGGLKYAIDERPHTATTYTLGATFAAAGEHTLTLSTKNCDADVWLTDNVTGVQTLLSENDYTFSAEAGTYAKRFSVALGTTTTGISAVTGEGADSSSIVGVYTVDGRAVGTLGTEDLPAGLYVVKKANGRTEKVLVK